MSYEYIEHEADVGIKASGATLEESFEEGAKAMLNVMFDLSLIDEREDFSFEVEAEDIAGLFVEFLNEILYRKDTTGLAFSRAKVNSIEKKTDAYLLHAAVYGELLNIQKHDIKTDVKAATYSGLKFYKEDNRYILQCILDV